MKRRETRVDATRYTTPEDAYQHLAGRRSGAEAARLRMLQRMGLDAESGSATDARDRMISRREQRHKK